MKLLKSSAIVGFYTLLSRVLGFARDILIARFLGTTGPVEAFIVAFRIPNMFRRLVAEGAFTAAFVPMFSKTLDRDGRPAALRFADETLALLVTILVIFTVLAEIFMPQVMWVFAPGFGTKRPELFDTAVLFTRITLPYLLCMALVALFSGLLNSVYKFAAAAAAPILLNVILVALMLLGRDYFETPGHLLSWGVAAGGVGQLVWLAISCHRAGLSLRLPRPRLTPEVRRLLRLMVPGAISAGMTQINLLVGTIIATFITSAVSVLYYADRVYQFPLGIIGIAIGTALLPELSRTLQRDAETGGDESMSVQNRAVELSMLLTLPAAAALIAIPGAVITVMFQYGRFTAADTQSTAGVLTAFAAGLPAYVLIKILSPGFFARHDTKTPMIFAVVSMLSNIALSLLLVWPPFGLTGVGFTGIAIATAAAAWINTILLAIFLVRRGFWRVDRRLLRRLPRIVLASVLMGFALLPAADWLAGALTGPVAGRIAAMAALVTGGMVAYAVIALAIGAASLNDLRRLLRRRGGGS